MTPLNTEAHFDHLVRLLKLESQAEIERTQQRLRRYTGPKAEKSGETLLDLVISAQDGGLGGRMLLTLRKRNQTLTLPWNRFSPGTPAMLSEADASQPQSWQGIISQRKPDSLQLALETWPDSNADTFRLDIAHNSIATQRQQNALSQARTAKAEQFRYLRRVLLNQQEASFGPRPNLQFFSSDLNTWQEQAVQRALAAHEVMLIHGPPGTGKTTTVVELICQAVQQGLSVLACAPSNMAVDNIFERLLASGQKAIRLGHPARVLPELREQTLDLLLENHPDIHLARQWQKDAFALQAQAGKFTRSKPPAGYKRQLRQEARNILNDVRRLESQTIQRILDGADILCATTTGLDSDLLGERQFDLVVIDEAGQATEPECWIPLLRSKHLVLAGDPYQLPPTIIDSQAEREGLGQSLMERLLAQQGANIAQLLAEQYRMHQQIMNFSSKEFYAGELRAHPSVAQHCLADLPGIIPTELTESPLHFIDTAGASYDEETEPDGESRFNPQEAALIAKKTEALLEAGLSPTDIAIIAPYSAQVRYLRELLPDPDLDINSVDGFQGREKEAVLISLVRANADGQIGFLAETRRMNVALTRARRFLLVIGDSATLTTHPFYQHLITYFESQNAYRSVWEELY